MARIAAVQLISARPARAFTKSGSAFIAGHTTPGLISNSDAVTFQTSGRVTNIQPSSTIVQSPSDNEKVSNDTVKKITGLANKLLDLAKDATKPALSKTESDKINTDFANLVLEYQDIIDHASNEDLAYLSNGGLEEALKSSGLKEEEAKSIADLLNSFVKIPDQIENQLADNSDSSDSTENSQALQEQYQAAGFQIFTMASDASGKFAIASNLIFDFNSLDLENLVQQQLYSSNSEDLNQSMNKNLKIDSEPEAEKDQPAANTQPLKYAEGSELRHDNFK